MTINIGNHPSSAEAVESRAQLAGVSHARNSRSDAAPAASGNGDRAQWSAAASLVGQAAALPDVRMDRVAAMQSAIASGYHVGSPDVADAMMNHMLNRSR